MDIEKLPNDIEVLKDIILDYEGQVAHLKNKMALLQRALFGSKSEKSKGPKTREVQFPWPELIKGENKEPEPTPEVKDDTITVPEHKRKKRGRKPIPADLPRKEIIHDLTEKEKICPCGTVLSPIGDEVSEKIDYTPAQIVVERHVRRKYACKCCEGVESDQGAVKIAPMPPQFIPQGIVTPGLVAHVLTAKFVDGIPLYRQEKQFKRLGIDLSRSTMVSWAKLAAKKCKPLTNLFKQEVLLNNIINIDETTVQVLKEPGKSNTSTSYMWVFLGNDPNHKVVFYNYQTSRSAEALEFLKDHKGYIQTDGYAGYNELGNRPDIIHVGCMAHVRRKFIEVTRLTKKDKKKGGTAQKIVDLIGKLYLLEKHFIATKLEPDRIKEERLQKSVPILDQIKSILDERKNTSPPKSKLGSAINYALGQWDRVTSYVLDGRLRPDNNLVENSIRPFAVGRKNWLFHGSPNGAENGALFYSIIETAKLNDLEPYAYLRYLFENLPLVKTEADLKKLLPQYIDKSFIQAYEIPHR
ncbi:MAG: IS66 family transposase [Desulfonatronovibrio sp.]|nr:IS66 family transposase [Desulfovibrionales bacterium]